MKIILGEGLKTFGIMKKIFYGNGSSLEKKRVLYKRVLVPMVQYGTNKRVWDRKTTIFVVIKLANKGICVVVFRFCFDKFLRRVDV